MISSYRNTPSPSAVGPDGVALLRYLDVVLVAIGAPIFILMGVSPVGYGVGAGAWVALRALGAGLDRFLRAADARKEISLRLAYLMTRVFLLALAVILVRRGEGKDAALTALGVTVFAFTLQLATSFMQRPRRSR